MKKYGNSPGLVPNGVLDPVIWVVVITSYLLIWQPLGGLASLSPRAMPRHATPCRAFASCDPQGAHLGAQMAAKVSEKWPPHAQHFLSWF